MDDVKYRLQAFTLMETVVAFVIIMISFSIAGATFLSVEYSSKFWIKLKAESEMDDLLIQTKMNRTFLNESIEFNEFIIDKDVNQISKENGLIEVQFTAITMDNRKIAEKITRIKVPDE